MIKEELYILRGIIKKNNSVKNEANLANYVQIYQKGIKFSEDTVKVMTFVDEYYKATSGFPGFIEVIDEFKKKGDLNLVKNLEVLETLDDVSEESFSYNLTKYLKEFEFNVARIALEEGLNYLKENYTTAQLSDNLAEDALAIVNQKTWDLYSKSNANLFTSGDMEDYHKRFQQAVAKAQEGETPDVIPSGLKTLDVHIDGLRRGDLSFICGFTGSFKTGSCVNWALSAIKLGYNVLYISMENSATQLINQLISSHACSAKFDHIGANPPTHTDILSGMLNSDQLTLIEAAYQDYNFNKDTGEYGQLFIHQPDNEDVTLSNVKNISNYYNAKCGNQLDMIVLDSPALMIPEKYSRDQKASMNHIIRSLKLFALTFNRGKGVALLCPHQINREGHDRAVKDEKHLYDHKCIADLNEIERSADLIFTIFSDDEDLRVSNQLLIQFLKTRNFGAPKYQNFTVFANMGTRKWGDLGLDASPNYEDNFDFGEEMLEDILVGEE